MGEPYIEWTCVRCNRKAQGVPFEVCPDCLNDFCMDCCERAKRIAARIAKQREQVEA